MCKKEEKLVLVNANLFLIKFGKQQERVVMKIKMRLIMKIIFIQKIKSIILL
jgi:hypothetical protein